MIARRCTVLLLLVAGAVGGGQEVEAQGSQLADLDRALYSCTQDGEQTLCRAAGTSLDHLGVPILGMTVEYHGELLQRTTVLLDEARFAELESRLTTRFGTPENHDEQLRAGMAGTIINRVRVWRSGGDIAMLEQYSGKITTSVLRYLTVDDYRQFMRSRDAMRVRGMRDL